MKRRSFMASLIGLVLAPLTVLAAKPKQTVTGVSFSAETDSVDAFVAEFEKRHKAVIEATAKNWERYFWLPGESNRAREREKAFWLKG